MLAYHIGSACGLDIDKQRNLSKTVTLDDCGRLVAPTATDHGIRRAGQD